MKIDKFKQVQKLIENFRLYYKKIKGVDVSLIKNIEELPFSTRDDLKKLTNWRQKDRPFFITRTSGSSQESFFILRSRKSFYSHLERQVKIYKCLKLTSKDRFLNLLSYSISGAARIIDEALRKIGVCVISVGSIKSNEHLDFVVKTVRELKPTVIQSYVNGVFDVFNVLGRKHSIKKCILTGEYMSEDFCKMISRMGNVEVYNNYGSMEFSGFAVTAGVKDEYMELFEDGLFIEVLKDDGSIDYAGKGKIVITDTENDCMPFIRYILGDIVHIVKRGRKKYIRVIGRTEDTILIDGETFSKTEITEIIQQILGHPKFFIIINKNPNTYKDKILINISSKDVNKKTQIVQHITKIWPFAYLAKICIYSGSVPQTSTGKYRHLIDLRKNA